MAKPRRPRDTNQLAKFITDVAAGNQPNDKGLNGHKHEGQRLGGLKGGKARAQKLTDEERKAIAVKAAKKRWDK